MKKLFTLIAIAILATSTTHAQDITHTLGASGKFIINNSSNANLLEITDNFTSSFKLTNTGSHTTDLQLYNAGHNNKLEFYSAKGTSIAPTSVDDGYGLGIIYFHGYSGGYVLSSSITSNVDGTPGAYVPSDIQFSTATATTGTKTRLTIESSGRVNIATVLKLTPLTSAPASPEKGDIYFDDATTKAKYYDGTNWVNMGSGASSIDDLTDAKSNNSSYYIGDNAGATATGTLNTSVGSYSLDKLTTGEKNTVIGGVAGANLTTGSFNTIVGTQAGYTTTGSKNILIGSNIQPSSDVANEELNIGNIIYATGLTTSNMKVGIGNGNNAPNSTLDVKGSFSLAYAEGNAIPLTDAHYTYNVTGATGGVIVLPLASSGTGRVYVIKCSVATTKVQADVTDSIDGLISPNNYIDLTSGQYLQVQSTGSNWIIIGQN